MPSQPDVFISRLWHGGQREYRNRGISHDVLRQHRCSELWGVPWLFEYTIYSLKSTELFLKLALPFAVGEMNHEE